MVRTIAKFLFKLENLMAKLKSSMKIYRLEGIKIKRREKLSNQPGHFRKSVKTRALSKICFIIITTCLQMNTLICHYKFFNLVYPLLHAVSQSLSYTKKTISSAVSILSLGYTSGKKDEWTDAFVLLRGITTQAVRFCSMQSHVQSGFYLTPDAPNVSPQSV